MEHIEYNEQWTSREWIMSRYTMYKTLLFRISFSYLGNKHDCEDILQEAYIRLCFHAPDFPSDEDEKRWMIRITINLCKNHLRSYWYRNKIAYDTLEEYASQPEEQELLTELIRLPVKYKSVIQLHCICGYRIKEISDILNISESAVKMRLKRGRERLKMELEDEVDG